MIFVYVRFKVIDKREVIDIRGQTKSLVVSINWTISSVELA